MKKLFFETWKLKHERRQKDLKEILLADRNIKSNQEEESFFEASDINRLIIIFFILLF